MSIWLRSKILEDCSARQKTPRQTGRFVPVLVGVLGLKLQMPGGVWANLGEANINDSITVTNNK